MKSLRILFITPYLPSLIRVRPYNLIKYLAGQGHRITLLALIPPGEDSSGLDSLRAWCWRVYTAPLPRWRTLWNGLLAIPGHTPFQAAYSRSPVMADLIRQTQAESTFEVAHVEHLRGAELGRAINDIPTVFDSVDSISLLFEHVCQSGPTWRSRGLARLDLARTRRYEGRLLEHYQRVLVTSPRDRATLVELATANNPALVRSEDNRAKQSRLHNSHQTHETNGRLVVLPNGVDLDYFSPLDTVRDPATLTFTGKMSYHANVAAALDLAKQVMPHVWQQLPHARLAIVGKDPAAELLALTEDPRIIVTGTVPDLRPYLAGATVAMSPIRYGVGIQNKVLEAMAMTTPVVSTPQAVSALQIQAGQEALVAGTPEEMAQAAVILLTDDTLRWRIGQTGRRYVETYHNWESVAKKLGAVYQEVIAEIR